jgi:hypothetical protein
MNDLHSVIPQGDAHSVIPQGDAHDATRMREYGMTPTLTRRS